MRKRSNIRVNRGVTIAEVLISMGIVAILCAVLIPAISMAKIGSRPTPDMVNLKKLGLAMQVYAIDANEWFPPAIDSLRPAELCAANATWRQRLVPYLESQSIFRSALVGPGHSRVCPVGSPVRILGNYGAQSLWALGTLNTDGPRLSVSHVQVPYDTLMLGPNQDGDALVNAPADLCRNARVRSGGKPLDLDKTPWVYIDGHATTLSRKEVYGDDCVRWQVVKPRSYF
ncbi:MAG: type II secretion system GspH family protein [Fimbriimonadaceae bacterium]|nr:type II secretion system GspH family protein [Fimbriimonadaceae bacterium]